MLSLSKKQIIYIWAILTYILYAEFFIYKLNSNNWLPIRCKSNVSCTKVLLVADPQIIGNLNEVFHPITPLSKIDSDRYLKITYSYAFDFVKPDVVVFLGDLMDEAHIASDHDFYSYVRRIFHIFLDPYTHHDKVKYIWLPGDNDIGGEDTMITPKKLNRFERAFSQPSLQEYNNITFFKINRLNYIIPVYKKEREFFDINKIFVGLSHVPLMFRPSQFSEKVINKMMPHVLFTAHEHKSMIITTDALLHKDYHITPLTPENREIYEYTLGVQSMYEILIPTCSYRMGTNKIGYGYAVIEHNELRFSILWSPTRFQYLLIYLIIIGLPLLIFLLYTKCGCVRKRYLRNRLFTY